MDVQTFANTLMARFDRNQDGVLSVAPDQSNRIEASRSGSGDRTFVFLSTSDYNRDYQVDRFELTQGVRRQLDLNKDGDISLRERAVAWFRFKL